MQSYGRDKLIEPCIFLSNFRTGNWHYEILLEYHAVDEIKILYKLGFYLQNSDEDCDVTSRNLIKEFGIKRFEFLIRSFINKISVNEYFSNRVNFARQE